MNKTEIIQVMLQKMEKEGLSKRKLADKIGIFDSGVGRFLNYGNNQRFDGVLTMLDALDLKLVVEDKDAEWGEDMARLRMMPKKLYVGERIESRELIRQEGFYPRVDLFDSLDAALKFVPKPLDVYEIRVGRLIRKKFDLNDHPFGTMYSYNEWIDPGAILNMVTYR